MDVPIIEHASGDLDTCAYGQISGADTNNGKHIAVRSGPGSSYAKIGELKSGTEIWLFDQHGEWHGIVYGVKELSCGPVKASHSINHPGNMGWVHEKRIKLIAG